MPLRRNMRSRERKRQDHLANVQRCWFLPMSVHHRGIPDSEDDLCARQYRAQVLAERGRSCTFCHEWTGLGLAAQKAENLSTQSAGKITRLACSYPCDSPVVTIVWLPLRMLARTVSHGLACQRRVKNTALAGVTMHHRGGVYGGAKLVQVG